MLKKFLMLAVALMAIFFARPVSAEQAAAEQYRQMFRAGNFYVEYQLVNHMWDIDWSERLLGQKTFRMKNAPFLSKSNKKSKNVAFASQNGARVVKSNLKENTPLFMYRDGKYYNYLNGNIFLILPEEQLNSPVLDPDEGWQNIREKLALPEELAIFYWEDSFRDKNSGWGAPFYSGSSTLEIKKKTYDCDKYIIDIKSLAGTLIAQEVYNALYENGKLVMVQKYFIRDGKEILLETLNVKEITAQVPAEAFTIAKKIKTYAPKNGDMNDLLEIYKQTGEIGGAQG